MNKIKLFLFLSICSLSLFSCKSTRDIEDKQINQIVKTAENYLGTNYKYGGTNKYGMDCSGLVYTSFLENNIKLPRTSLEQSKQGESVKFKNLTKGDLLFFKNPNSTYIDHVGIVVSKDLENINFIHASSSKGVIISSIKERYWQKAFIKGKRLIATPTKVDDHLIFHKVKTGDTLYGISKKYHTNIQSIKKLNNLKSDDISIGMILKIQ